MYFYMVKMSHGECRNLSKVQIFLNKRKVGDKHTYMLFVLVESTLGSLWEQLEAVHPETLL